MTVLISDDASIYLDDLIEILYKKEYFGFIESAEIYVANIYDFIFQNINNFPFKKTPIKLEAFGSNYIFYKSNTRTTWYIFFEKFNDNYLVTHIINNHCEEAKWF